MQLEQLKNKQQDLIVKKWNALKKHPFFGVFIAAIVMVLIQVLGSFGIIESNIVENLAKLWIYIIVGLGFTLLLGYAGLASLGTAGFIGLGSYTVAFFLGKLGLPFFMSFVIGIMIAIIAGSIVGFISLRIEGMYLAIITLGLSEILTEFFKNAIYFTGGNITNNIERFSVFGINMVEAQFYYILVIALVITMLAVLNIVDSPTGRAMLSIKNSTSAAQAMGISVLKYRLLTFVIATVLAVVAGMLIMGYERSTYPDKWGLAVSLNILAAVVIGGAKSIWGVGLGTFLIFSFDQLVLKRIPFFQTYGNASYIINGILIIVIVMYYPGGLIRLFKDLKVLIIKGISQTKLFIKEYRYGKD